MENIDKSILIGLLIIWGDGYIVFEVLTFFKINKVYWIVKKDFKKQSSECLLRNINIKANFYLKNQ